MPVNDLVANHGAATETPKTGLLGGAGGDVRGKNRRTNSGGTLPQHKYSGGRWEYADDVGGVDEASGLGNTHFGPVQYRAGCTYYTGDRVVDPANGKIYRVKASATGGRRVVSAAAAAPNADGTNWEVQGYPKNTAGRYSVFLIPTLTVAVAGTPATGNIKVDWGNPPTTPAEDDIAGYELIAFLAKQDDQNLAVDLPGVTDPDDMLAQVTGQTVKHTLVTADGATTVYDNWDLSVFGAAADVVIGVRAYTDQGARGPWAWVAGTTNAVV